MEFENVILEKKANIATITLNRPKAFNAFDFGLGNDLVKALEICTDDRETKVVIITGAGKAFCAGGDLAFFKKLGGDKLSDGLRQIIKILNTGIMGIRRMPKPVIAAINGAVGGAGMSIAAACDLRICASSVKFKQGYITAGLVPDGAWTLSVSLLVGFGKATEIALLDPVFDAQDALKFGLVTRVVEDAEFEKETLNVAASLARGPAVSYAIVKDNLNQAMYGLLERQLELERRGMTWVGQTSDALEGINAFVEKRKPDFTGR
ncbi:MAG: enoyl-CoA hydratase/isomerase family protein [Deltaproteobacteria bacterium]|nr:enoyl-CoA hydratase/isomerase family protein [Deltaproteobacteria bacterium]